MAGNLKRDERTEHSERTQRTAAREAQREAQARTVGRARDQLEADIKTAHAASTGLVRADALYRQLAAALREGIATGQYPPGTLLPSESALMAAHSLSRPTVRQAFEVLASQGLIDTYNGRGRMVRTSSGAPARTLHRTADAAEAFIPTGKPHRYRAPANSDLAALLGIPADEPTFIEERVSSGQSEKDSEPVGAFLYRRVLPFSIAENTSLQHEPYPEHAELLRTLADAYGSITWTEYVRARMPQPDETTALHLPEGTPILEIVRIATTASRPVFAETERRSAETLQYAYRLTSDDTKDTEANRRDVEPAS